MKENLVRRGKEEQIICGRKSKGRKIFGKENYWFANIRTKMVYEKHRYRLLVVNILVFNTNNHLSQQVISADRLICRKFLKILPEPENILQNCHF